MIQVKEEIHFPEGRELPDDARQEVMERLIEGNLVQLAAAAWQMHEECGRGMLVLRTDELAAPIPSKENERLVDVPYVTEQGAPPEADKVCLLMQTYDPLAEMMIAVAFPEGALSFFVIETDPSPPVAAAATRHRN